MRTPDIKHAQEFIDLLAGDSPVTFQTFPETENCRDYPQVFHGTLAEHAEILTKLNQQGSGVFVMVNQGDGIIKPSRTTCRTNANVIRVCAHFVDLDGSPLGPIINAEAKPNIVVESSPGRWHAYWITTDTKLGEFSIGQSALADKFNGDPSVKDLARVMRLPGFYHQKGEPFMTRMLTPPVTK